MLTDKYTSRRYDVQDATNIDTEVLEHVPFDYPASASDVTDRGGISAHVKARYQAS